MNAFLRHLTHLTFAATTLFGTWTIAPSAWSASQFGQQELNPNQIIAVAQPGDNGKFYKLLIFRQLTNQRACWQEQGSQPTQVDPLLLTFDFTGICDRSIDSNGYSVRVGGEDLDWRYRLQISQRGNDLVLLAVSAENPRSPALEIGHTQGISPGLLKIYLNPGWRMTQRTYNSQALGHIYLTNNQPLSSLIASTPTAPTPTPTPIPAPTPVPANPPNSIPLPTIPVPSTPLPPPLPPSSPTPSTVPPTSPSGTYYRVIVPSTSPQVEAKVHQIEPGAFRTTLNGQSVIQAGLFRELRRAEDLQQQLAQANIPVQILQTTGPIPTPTTPNLPQIPAGQVLVILDPGHGGRDPGAIGIGGIQEKEINLDISRQVQQALQQQGVTALLTRTGDQEIDLDPRVTMAEQAHADLFVSIHSNAIDLSRPDVNGLETYYYTSGLDLARTIHARILREMDMRDRGVRQARFYVLRYTSMPSVLVETGFVTGSEDAARFNNSAAREQLARAIAGGILDYIRQAGIGR
jgi:N-acetylmuramoyl-L-alanine amidase